MSRKQGPDIDVAIYILGVPFAKRLVPPADHTAKHIIFSQPMVPVTDQFRWIWEEEINIWKHTHFWDLWAWSKVEGSVLYLWRGSDTCLHCSYGRCCEVNCAIDSANFQTDLYVLQRLAACENDQQYCTSEREQSVLFRTEYSIFTDIRQHIISTLSRVT